MSIFVFPSCLEASRKFANEAKAWGQKVVGASSLDDDPYAPAYDAWEKLPYVNSAEFLNAFKAVVARHDVKAVFVPHAPSHLRLSELLPAFPDLKILNPSPPQAQQKLVVSAIEDAEHGLKAIRDMRNAAKNSTGLDVAFVAALLDNAESIYGECSREKILALCSIFSGAPKGDVVEIGSFFGKSAFALNRLAARFATGTTLAIDPWDCAASVQRDSNATIQALSHEWDWDLVFKGFLLNMAARFAPPFNYLRLASEEAWSVYENGGDIESPEFGKTPLKGEISVLHIDGNHDAAAVAIDFKLWSQALASGAWMVFDDYEWPHGDGPRLLVNKIRIDWRDRIKEFFIAGGAAFIKVE